MLASASLAQDEVDSERYGSGNVAQGKLKSQSELCQGCHGERGESSGNGFPRLSGQYAAYLGKQLLDFQSGARSHPVMGSMASSLSATDIADISAYFASAPLQRDTQPTGDERTRHLFAKGDLKRHLLACAGCHGNQGEGAYIGGEVFPAIAGQRKLYLREQLLAWRAGTRKNSPGGVMNLVAGALTTEEIEALAAYISAM